jgi:lysophospholipase L1-like esterase
MVMLYTPVQVSDWMPGNTAVIFGDSRTAQNNTDAAAGGGVYNVAQAVGYFTWLQMLSGHAFNLLFNLGKSGDTVNQFLARLPQAIAARPAWFFYLGGVNSISAGLTAAQIMPDIITACDAMLAVGSRVVLMTEAGGAGTTYPAMIQQLGLLNQLIREYAESRRNVILVDIVSAVRSPTQTTPTLQSPLSGDGTHYLPGGAYKVAQTVYTAVAPLLPNFPTTTFGLLDEYTYNPQNAMTNGLFTTATGGTTSAGFTGSVPSGWRASNSNTTVTGTVTTYPEPRGAGNVTRIAAAPAAIGDMFSFYNAIPVNQFYPLDILEAEIWYRINSAAGFIGVELMLDINITVGGVTRDITSYDNFIENSAFLLGPRSTPWLKLKTRPRQIPAGATINSVTFYVKGMFGFASGSSSVDLKQGKLQKRLTLFPPAYNGITYP